MSNPRKPRGRPPARDPRPNARSRRPRSRAATCSTAGSDATDHRCFDRARTTLGLVQPRQMPGIRDDLEPPVHHALGQCGAGRRRIEGIAVTQRKLVGTCSRQSSSRSAHELVERVIESREGDEWELSIENLTC